MNALASHIYPAREQLIDRANHAETIAETLLPWPNLRASLDAEVEAMETRWLENRLDQGMAR